ncbi:hypothetical protein C1646_757335 [Rhizophagus diaphanus]|nr:hypothetical protein C1646_757335 [Rhizophagus diaphanus] [Rhizophagus sp. MUCL 43196]
MYINNSLPNSFSNNVYESNSQIAVTQTYDTYTPVTYSNTNVFSPPQSYNDQNQPSNPSQSNILPLLNSFGININSPQATNIIMPTTNSDIQNQLQWVLARFNNKYLTFNE